MAGIALTEADINDLLSTNTHEDLHLDYKSGKELLKSNASDTIRQYLTGFANADGGLLIIGVSDSFAVESEKVPGGRGFGHWAASCVSDIAPLFSPPPRFQEIEHPDGTIYVAGVSRSLNLIPCREGGRFVYYLRIHDQTRKAPDYLVSDLILGRRQHPLLNITGIDVPNSNITHSSDYNAAYAELQMRFSIENLTLHWAENLRLGIVDCSCSDYGTSISNQLLSYIDLKGWPNSILPANRNLYHSSQRINDIEPFTENHESLNRDVIIPMKSRQGRWISCTWKAALYLIGKNTPPVWFQITLDIDQPLLDAVNERENVSRLVRLERVVEGRPIVSIENVTSK